MTDIFLRPTRVCLLCFCMLTVLCPSAKAQSHRLSLAFQSSSVCATEVQFNRALDALLAGWQGQSTAHFAVFINHTELLEIVLKVTDGGQAFERKVVIDNCDLAPRVAALLVALTLDPATLANMSDTAALDALSKGEKARAAGGDQSQAVPEDKLKSRGADKALEADDQTADAGNDKEAASEATAIGGNHSISFWVNTTMMVLPQAGFGPAVEYGWRRYSIAPIIDGRFSFSSQKNITRGQASAALRLWLFSAHVGAEWAFAGKRWIFSPRLGVGLHLFVAKAIDFPDNFRDQHAVFSPWVGGVVRFRLTETVGLMAVVNADWLLANSTYRLQAGEMVHETGHVLLQVGVGFFHNF